MPWIRRIVPGRLPTAGVFFSIGLAAFQPGDLIGDLDESLSQVLEALVVSHVGLDLLGLVGGNTLGALAALEIALQDVIGTLADLFTLAFGEKKLLAQGATPQTIDVLDLLKDVLPLATQLRKGCLHAWYIVSIPIQ